MSVLTFKITVILYVLYTEEKNKTSLFKSLYPGTLTNVRTELHKLKLILSFNLTLSVN
jgi:hypothetical protein